MTVDEMRACTKTCHARPSRMYPPARRRASERQEHLLDLLMIGGLLAVAHEPLVWLFGGRDALAELLDVCGSTVVLAGVVVILLLFAKRLLTQRLVLARTFANRRW